MADLTNTEYQDEIKSLAETVVEEAKERDPDNWQDEISDVLHEWIDGHQWVIYNAYNLDVLQHSSNPDYYIDNFGEDDAVHVLKERGVSGLHNVLAYGAMYGDVSDKLPN